MSEEIQKRMQVLTELQSRLQFASLLNMYQGDRDLNKALGYPQELKLEDYVVMYKREAIGNAVINRPIKATWKGDVTLLEATEAQDTLFEKAWVTLWDSLKLKNRFLRLDRLVGLGKFALLLIGTSDIKDKEAWKTPVNGKTLTITFIRPISEAAASVKEYETDPTDKRFGLPKLYEITLKDNQPLIVHHTRVLHVFDDALDSDVFGTPRLEAVFNRLQDLQKLVGGSAEMYWRGARPGFALETLPEYTMGAQEEEELMKQIDEYEHNLRRILTLQGAKLNSLNQQVSDPTQHVDVQLQMISAQTNIPKRILTGSERGELASSQDSDNWATFIQSRREEFAEVAIIRPFVDFCITHGILPKPAKEYSVQWENLFMVSDKDFAAVGEVRSRALKNYADSPLAQQIVGDKAFMEFFLGLTQEQIELIQQMSGEAIRNEENNLLKELEEDSDV